MKDIKKMNDNEINIYVEKMLIGVKPLGVKEMLHKRLLGILGLYFKQKEELETCKFELKELKSNCYLTIRPMTNKELLEKLK